MYAVEKNDERKNCFNNTNKVINNIRLNTFKLRLVTEKETLLSGTSVYQLGMS